MEVETDILEMDEDPEEERPAELTCVKDAGNEADILGVCSEKVETDERST